LSSEKRGLLDVLVAGEGEMVEIRDLRMGRPAPNFRLTATSGVAIELRSYRHRQPVVLFFAHDAACSSCEALLRKFQEHYVDYQNEGVAIIAISPTSVSDTIQLGQRLGLAFNVLADPECSVYDAFKIGSGQAGLFVLDRYNGQQAGEQADDANGLMSPAEALQWAMFSETTCPECGVLEWPESE
jgi:thioredoxin-dependent peroxiredoxin